MYDDIIKKILESVDENKILTETYPKFSGEGYRTHKIDAKNFYEIKPLNSGKMIAFIDGGNAEIIGSANFSLNLIRACYVVYNNNKRIGIKKFEVLAFIQAVNQSNEIHYRASFFRTNNAVELEQVSFSSLDNTLMRGVSRADIRNVADAIRRFAELKLAKQVSDKKIADVIVLDGNLQATFTNENSYLSELYDSCTENNTILTAISKTSSLFTENGNLLGVLLDNISNIPAWLYYPIVEISNHNHKADMFFVKFHEKSRHVFRFEIFNAQKLNAEETINSLASNCADPIFIGYPYGLVEADKIARVSNQEKESLKTIFLVKIKNKNILKYFSSVNAHEILDRVSF